MLTANQWEVFRVIDCNFGMKLEQWGEYILYRPDPQVLWGSIDGIDLSDVDAEYHRSSSGGGEWEFKTQLPNQWVLKYKKLKFIVRPTDFKHMGLFPEQAVNWDAFAKLIKRSSKENSQVLNLFAYTGAASIACAKAGSTVTHVDASKGMIHWCKQNAELNEIPEDKIRYIVDDCLKFVKREAKRGKKYDAIIMDPPSYGRGKSGETWKVEKHLFDLVEACVEILTEDANFFHINSYTSGMSHHVLENILVGVFGNGYIHSEELGLPIDSDNRVLPCGVFARWEND